MKAWRCFAEDDQAKHSTVQVLLSRSPFIVECADSCKSERKYASLKQFRGASAYYTRVPHRHPCV